MRRLAPDGLEARKQVIMRGYEGYVAKDEASVCEGGLTKRWLKVKQKGLTIEGDGWASVLCSPGHCSLDRIFDDLQSIGAEAMRKHRDERS